MSTNYKKIFVTVGTTRFDTLCTTINKESTLEALKRLGCKDVTMQIGSSDLKTGEYVKCGINLELFKYKDSLDEDIMNADLVISHAGAGTCLEVLEANKPLLVVVNEDLMDNHQLELAEQLQVDGHLYYCTCDTLESTLQEVDFSLLKPFPKPDASLFVKFLDDVFKVTLPSSQI
ncbi:UDP-N-acetylglucosamine transferase subunit ALG13 homolog [Cydia pomonella]|uniref:UDP-N-acetylglucosamine transferase subunit ALG13 homolog n=1 Tax=Cydia pomonella TaxID=82600 RepID=UPI002ADE8D35|nr:UDP-N-acetylglucosamine transferase subunit ALG13 homolog [Cydia pomonella]